jgi:threonine dehydratase
MIRGEMTEHSIRAVRRPEVADVDQAYDVVSKHLEPTPLISGSGRPDLMLKLETMQPTGAFKVRGALNALASAAPDEHLVTASAGNHGLGVAWASAVTGRPATIVVSRRASPAKVSALRELGADVVEFGESYDDAEQHATELAADGRRYLSAYNDPDVIAGQGTIGLEVARQVDGPLTIVAPIGGGGLAAGLGLWASQRDDVNVVGVESELSKAVSHAVRTGSYADVPIGDTLADGMAGNVENGSVTVDLIRGHVDDLVTVSEKELRHAITILLTRYGVLAEAAGAASLAAVLSDRVRSDATIVCVVSGRNIAVSVLNEVLADS